jgi:hypothetical protein
MVVHSDDNRWEAEAGSERRRAVRLTDSVVAKYPELAGLSLKIADTTAEIELAFRLVHDVYAGIGLIDPRPSGLYVIPHQLHPEMRIFVALLHGEVISTLTLIPDGPMGLPQDELYAEELRPLREAGRRLAEVGCLAMHPKWQKHDLILFLYRIMHYYAYHSTVDDLCIVANPRHGRFYQRVLLFEQYGIQKPFSKVKGAPAVGYRLDLRSMERRYKEFYSVRGFDANLHDFFFTSWNRDGRLPGKGRPLTEAECMEFFCRRECLIQRLPPVVLDFLTNAYQAVGRRIDFSALAVSVGA